MTLKEVYILEEERKRKHKINQEEGKAVNKDRCNIEIPVSEWESASVDEDR